MNSPLIGENQFLLYSIAMGVFVTFVYDLLRILRRVISHNSFFVSVEDLLFWLFCAISVFMMMHRQSNGTLRWFAVLGAMVGMLVYKKTLSGIFVKWVSRILKFLLGWLCKPFGLLKKPAAAAGRRGKELVRQSGRFVKKRLTKYKKMLRMILCKQ